jgi:hypothetical protein
MLSACDIIAPRYYDAYLTFVIGYLQHNTPTEALEYCIYPPAYNFVSGCEATEYDSTKHPQMD